MEINDLTYRIIGCAYAVHSALGPGMLESTYRKCLVHELEQYGLGVQAELALPVNYKGVALDAGYRLDILVEDLVILELKAVDALHPVHFAQLLTYLRLSGKTHGLLFNFKEKNLKNGFKRVINSQRR